MKTMFIALLMLGLMAASLMAFAGNAEARGSASVGAGVRADSGNSGSEETGRSADKEETGRAPMRKEMPPARAMMEKRGEEGKMPLRALKASEEERIRLLARQKNLSASAVATMRLWMAKEETLECANATTLRERVACRIDLPREEQEEGLYYMPEECRRLQEDERAACLDKYDRIQPCRFLKGDDARFTCVREKINFTRSARDEVEACKRQVRMDAQGEGEAELNASEGTETTARINASNPGIGRCVAEVRSKAMDEARFRLYNLQEKAERLLSYNVSRETVVEFVAAIDELKVRLDAAATASEKKEVLREAAQAWEAFVKKARAEAVAAKRAAGSARIRANVSADVSANASG